MTKIEKLQTARDARIEEVENYQINIDNYSLAIAAIDASSADEQAEQAAFRQQLAVLLVSEKREQAKAQIMLNVLEQQLSVM